MDESQIIITEGALFAALEFITNSFLDVTSISHTPHQARRQLDEASYSLNKLTRLTESLYKNHPTINLKNLIDLSEAIRNYWYELDYSIPTLEKCDLWKLSKIGKETKNETEQYWFRIEKDLKKDPKLFSEYENFLSVTNNLYTLLGYKNEKELSAKITPGIAQVISEKAGVRRSLCKHAISMKEFSNMNLKNKGFEENDIVMVMNALVTEGYCKFNLENSEPSFKILTFAESLIEEILG